MSTLVAVAALSQHRVCISSPPAVSCSSAVTPFIRHATHASLTSPTILSLFRFPSLVHLLSPSFFSSTKSHTYASHSSEEDERKAFEAARPATAGERWEATREKSEAHPQGNVQRRNDGNKGASTRHHTTLSFFLLLLLLLPCGLLRPFTPHM